MKKNLLVLTFLGIYSISLSQITLSVNQQNVQCFGLSNGSATVTPNGGIPAYSYTWMPGGQTSPAISGLVPGDYTVHVEDAATATASVIVSIVEPPVLNIVVSYSNVSCGGYNDGFIQIIGTGGSGSVVTYMTSNSMGAISATPYVYNLSAGIYTCSITDAFACTATQTVLINQPPPLASSITSTNTSCNGICIGAASITTTGGVAPYSYSSQPPLIITANTSSLCAGIYTVYTTDANGCSFVNGLWINNTGGTSLPNATVTSLSYNESCYLSADGAIDITITGSNPGPFTYQWSNGATTQDLTNISSNQYQLTITDANSNCMTLRDTINSVGINCGTISGNVYIDNNSDCNNNSGDYNANNVTVIISPGNRLGYTNLQGDYSINNLPYGTYSVILNPVNTNLSPSCITSISTSVNGGNPNSANNDLSLGFNSAIEPDINVSAYSGNIVPGFSNRVYYALGNLNNVPGTGILKATLPSAFTPAITGASPSTYTVLGDTIAWNFNAVTYYSATTFYIDFTTPLNIPLGSLFESCAYAQTSVSDFSLLNNTFCYQRIVTGSYDPNDKTVSPVGIGPTGDIAATETDLTYLIRFQNTGNGPAINIIVKDTLSPNVDINTFEMLSASHNYNIDILDGNVLRWNFNNIMLPDSNSNEPASHGYIQYRIKRNSNNTPGTQIKNTAYIYFDFNEPIMTNIALNTIEIITSVSEKTGSSGNLSVYPNPNNGIFEINSSNEEKYTLQLTNAIGQIIQTTVLQKGKTTLDLSHEKEGIYFYHVLTGDKVVNTNKIVIIK
jgi:uncharacterized repeat protein (TIGR01451 family)